MEAAHGYLIVVSGFAAKPQHLTGMNVRTNKTENFYFFNSLKSIFIMEDVKFLPFQVQSYEGLALRFCFQSITSGKFWGVYKATPLTHEQYNWCADQLGKWVF